MTLKQRACTLSVSLLLTVLTASSQTVVNAGGSTIANASTVLEYSIGEIAITTLTGTNNQATQGLLQPKLKVIDPSCEIINSELLSFENPTRDKVRLVGRYDWISDYQIYAADGKLIAYSRFANNYIELSRLPAAVYFIRLFPGCNGNYKVIKVVKQ